MSRDPGGRSEAIIKEFMVLRNHKGMPLRMFVVQGAWMEVRAYTCMCRERGWRIAQQAVLGVKGA